MKPFLAGTRDDAMRWLPAPRWEPAWQSEAALECANSEAGPVGAWGEDTIRTVYVGAALYPDTILRCIQGLADGLTRQTTPYVVNALARAAMEAGAQLWWLLEPGIGRGTGWPGSGWRAPRERGTWTIQCSGSTLRRRRVPTARPRRWSGQLSTALA